jgi:hypothetical protein
VRRDRGCTEPAGEYTFFYAKGNENHELGTGFSVHKIIISAVKRVEFINGMSYIILRGHWCDSIVLNIHAPTENKIDDVKDSFCKELERVFANFPKCHMKILLRDINAKVGREDIFKLTIGNDNLHKISNGNGVKVIKYARSKNLTVKSTMFRCHNVHKFTWTSPDGNLSHIDQILIGKQLHSSMSRHSEQLIVILTTIRFGKS